MNFQQWFRIFITAASIAVGIYFFRLSVEKNLSLEIAFTLAIAPFLRTFLKIAYEIRRGEIECRYLGFLKNASSEKTEQDIIYGAKP